MKLVNNSDNNLSHDKIYLKIGEISDIPKEVAEIWLQFEGVEEVITKEDVNNAVKQALASKSGKGKNK